MSIPVLSNLTNRIAAGTNELFTVSGNVELKGVEVADYNGNMLNTRVNKTALPTSFALVTERSEPVQPDHEDWFVALPTQSDWTLEHLQRCWPAGEELQRQQRW